MSTSIAPASAPATTEQAHAIAQRLLATHDQRLQALATRSGIIEVWQAQRVLAEAILDAIAAENRACEQLAEEVAGRRERSSDAASALLAASIAAALRERLRAEPQVMGTTGERGT